jgi:hypothetical protein
VITQSGRNEVYAVHEMEEVDVYEVCSMGNGSSRKVVKEAMENMSIE